MSKIVLYSNPHSRGMRVDRLVEVFDIPHEMKLVDLQKGENKTEEYLKIHPYGRVPALVHGDTVVVESGAITLYLADLFPEKMNTPKPGTPERALLYEWILFFHSTLEQVAMEAFGVDDRSTVQKKVHDLLKAMSSRLKGPYALGEEFSLLDVIINVELGWYRMMKIFPDGLQPYEDFMERTDARIQGAVQAKA